MPPRRAENTYFVVFRAFADRRQIHVLVPLALKLNGLDLFSEKNTRRRRNDADTGTNQTQNTQENKNIETLTRTTGGLFQVVHLSLLGSLSFGTRLVEFVVV